MNSLQRFENDGLELVIDSKTGEVFYPGYRALSRVCSLGLSKDVDPKTVKRTVDSIAEGVAELTLKDAEIETQRGGTTCGTYTQKVGD